EQKYVSLQITYLDQPQQRADSPGSATAAIDSASIDNPSIKKRANTSKQFLCPDNQPGIKLIETKLVAQKSDVDRFARPVAIKCDCKSASDDQREQCKGRNQERDFFFCWKRKEVSRKKSKSSQRCRNSEHDERSCHHER